MKIGDLFIKLGLKKDGFDKGINDAKNQTSSFGNGLKNISKWVAGAFAVRSIANFAKEAIKLSGETENVRKAFVRLGGGEYFNELRQATRGTLSDVELMKNTIQASNFGIPIRNLGNLFKFATERASQTGQSVEYLTQSIVLGIGRKSPLILDNLGISAVQLNEKLKGTESTVDDVAAAVDAISTENLRKMGEQATTTGQKVESVAGGWNDVKIQIGDAINGSRVFLGILSSAAKLLDDLNSGQREALTSGAQNVQGFMSQISGMPLSGQKEAVKKEIAELQNSLETAESNITPYWQRILSFGKYKQRKQEVINIDTIKNQITQLQYIFDNFQIPETIEEKIKRLQSVIDVTTKMMNAPGISSDEYQQYADDIKNAQDQIDKLAGKSATLFEAAKRALIDAQFKLNKLQNTSGKWHGEDDAQSYIDKLSELKKAVSDAQDQLANFQRQSAPTALTPKNVFGEGGTVSKNEPGVLDQILFSDSGLKDIEMARTIYDQMDDLLRRKEEQTQKAKALKDKSLQVYKDFTTELNDIIKSGLSNAIASLSAGLGELAVGAITGKGFGNQVLQVVGNFMQQIGMAFITFSSLFIQFQAAIASMNPGLALGIGVALVAAGAAISGLAKKGLSGGASSAPAASGYTNFNSSTGASAISDNVVFELEGNKLIGVMKNSERRNSNMR